MLKYSQFNTIIPFEKEFALFNSFTQKVIFLVPELKDLLKAGIVEGVENIKNYHPSFFDYLVKKEFLVEASVDEVEKVKLISKSVDENEDEFLLTINPTMNCNFKCWYCYETHIKQSKLKDNDSLKIMKFIRQTIRNPKIKRLPLSIFGGEPLLYFEKNVIPLLDFYIEECKTKNIMPDIGFTTNGYLVNQKFVDYFNDKGIKCSLQITLDGYKDEHDEVRSVSAQKGSYDTIIENIHLLAENGFHVRVRINYTDKNIHNSTKIMDDFISASNEAKEHFLVFDFHRVWQNNSGEDVHTVLMDTLDAFKNKGFLVQGQGTVNNLTNSCYADKRNSVTINFNGDIYKCTARDFNKANRLGYIDDDGNLVWENDALNKRMDVKFKNKPCLSCRLLPLCNGGCSQAAFENIGTDYCVYNGVESEKDKVVMQHVVSIKDQYTISEVMEEEPVSP